MPEEPRLKRMCDRLRHLGLEGEGLWIEDPVGVNIVASSLILGVAVGTSRC